MKASRLRSFRFNGLRALKKGDCENYNRDGFPEATSAFDIDQIGGYTKQWE